MFIYECNVRLIQIQIDQFYRPPFHLKWRQPASSHFGEVEIPFNSYSIINPPSAKQKYTNIGNALETDFGIRCNYFFQQHLSIQGPNIVPILCHIMVNVLWKNNNNIELCQKKTRVGIFDSWNTLECWGALLRGWGPIRLEHSLALVSRYN